MTDKRIVLTTTGSREEAGRIAEALVQRRLAACVNLVGPITSVYRWQEKVEKAEEFLLLIKTNAESFPDVRDAIEDMHSYELPECIALAIEAGGAEYLDWIGDSVE